jgi:NADH dehydrogenase
VEQTLQLPEHPEVFVIGDMAYLKGPDGEPYPQLAAVAMQQGEQAAKNILRMTKDRSPQPFQYQDRGVMTTIGRSRAVASIFGRHLKGFVAWIIWLGVHLVYLIGFRNRLVVLINWTYNYLSYERGVRLIAGLRRECEPELAQGGLMSAEDMN